MSDKTDKEVQAPIKGFDLSQFETKPLPLATQALGTVYVLPMTLGRIREAARGTEDAATIGKNTVLLSTKLSVDKDADHINEEQYRRLTPADLEAITAAAAQVNGWTLKEGGSLTALGDALHDSIKKATKPLLESVSRIENDLKRSFDQLRGSFSAVTLRSMAKQIADGERLDEILNRSSWIKGLSSEMQARRLLGDYPTDLAVPHIATATAIEPEPFNFPTINVEETPVGRTAAATEASSEALSALLELNRSTLETLSNMSALGTRIAAENLAAQEDSRKNTRINLRIAAGALIVSVLLSLTALIQTWHYKQMEEVQQMKNEQATQQLLQATKRQSDAIEALAQRGIATPTPPPTPPAVAPKKATVKPPSRSRP